MSGINELSAHLSSIYGSSPDALAKQSSRYDDLQRHLAVSFPNHPARMYVRAPGRVNLIGEHTDYNGFPVMPLALDRDIVFAVAPAQDSSVELVNSDPRFGRRAFAAGFPVEPYDRGDWGNYIKAAVHGLLDAGMVEKKQARGFHAAVDGAIPESAGLSSSSAMVVAAALAFLAANNQTFDRKKLADVLARAERYVGSEGGGMDQAISLLAEPDHALRIDFFPLRTEPVPMRRELTFVVCNSLIRAPKSESVRYAYNLRVIECRLATALLAHALSQRTGREVKAARLADLTSDVMGGESAEMLDRAEEVIGRTPLSLKEVGARLGIPPEEVQRRHCMQRDGTPLAEPKNGFKIRQRFRHVIGEAERVGRAVDAFRRGALTEIGALMNQSHTSCRDDYEISCPELDVLVGLGLENGAIGARLTGAGFGGCTVHAVPTEHVDDFLNKMRISYYEGYVRREAGHSFVSYDNLDDVMFSCRATTGAGFWSVE